jgi:hypothetical protein
MSSNMTAPQARLYTTLINGPTNDRVVAGVVAAGASSIQPSLTLPREWVGQLPSAEKHPGAQNKALDH